MYKSECYDAYLKYANDGSDDSSVFEYDEFMLFNLAKDNVEACNLAIKYPEKLEELKDELFSQKNIKEYVKWNKDSTPVMSKQGTMAQANSYDCDTEKAYHVSWKELEGYENEEDLTWSFKQIFYKFLYNIDHCARYGTKAEMFVSFGNEDGSEYGVFTVGIAVVAIVSLIAYLFVIFNGFVKGKEEKKVGLSDESTPLVTSTI